MRRQILHDHSCRFFICKPKESQSDRIVASNERANFLPKISKKNLSAKCTLRLRRIAYPLKRSPFGGVNDRQPPAPAFFSIKHDIRDINWISQCNVYGCSHQICTSDTSNKLRKHVTPVARAGIKEKEAIPIVYDHLYVECAVADLTALNQASHLIFNKPDPFGRKGQRITVGSREKRIDISISYAVDKSPGNHLAVDNKNLCLDNMGMVSLNKLLSNYHVIAREAPSIGESLLDLVLMTYNSNSLAARGISWFYDKRKRKSDEGFSPLMPRDSERKGNVEAMVAKKRTKPMLLAKGVCRRARNTWQAKRISHKGRSRGSWVRGVGDHSIDLLASCNSED